MPKNFEEAHKRFFELYDEKNCERTYKELIKKGK